ncbi:hypothetical protein GOODEAATRI_008170 [Goodea atripinnis]|uniref:Ssl1-like domain-containing protein n=1 Tax=Goodea atripinnis TaxID=208336 RepID=A0ABV0NIF9_9TELE
MDEEPERAKRWEGGYERTWEVLKEDESGSLKATVEQILYQSRRKRVTQSHAQVRLGMMRHLYVVIDCSRSMEDQDLKPNRLTSTLKLMEGFVDEYFDQNPISQVGIIITKNKRAEKLTELAGEDQSASTMLKSLKVRVSVIGLSAEVRVCTVLTRETGGSYHVILDESHFKELLMLHVKPPPASFSSECSLIRMDYRFVRLAIVSLCWTNHFSCVCDEFLNIWNVSPFSLCLLASRYSPVLRVAVCSVWSVISSSTSPCTAVPAAFTVGVLHEAKTELVILSCISRSSDSSRLSLPVMPLSE